jgi:hypothetical protein
LTGLPVYATIAIHRAQETFGGAIPVSELRRAVDIFLTSAIFANDGITREQNSTTFTLYVQSLGGESGFMAVRTRRRNRAYLNGIVTNHTVTKPMHAETFTSYNKDLAAALIAAAKTGDNAWRLFDALGWFRRPSTDADNVEPEVDLVLLLTAIDFLLAHPATIGASLDQARIRQLLAPYDTVPCCSIRKSHDERSYIGAALYSLNGIRNASLHPRDLDDQQAAFAFQRAETTSFAWVVDRCFMALLVARLIELNVLARSDDLEAFISGVETWLQEPVEDVGLVITKEKLRLGLRRAFCEGYERDVLPNAVVGASDGSRVDWERDFLLCLGNVDSSWQFRVVWLKDGRGVVEVHHRRGDEYCLVEFFGFDPAEDLPARMAYAALTFSEDDAGTVPARDLTDADRRAMSNLGVWIGGGSYPT